MMILDSMEAAIRSESLGRELLRRDARETPENEGNRGRSQSIMALKKVIDQVVASKIAEGQFDEVNFTLRDLTRIKEALLNVLLSMYHTRRVKKIERRGDAVPAGAPASPSVTGGDGTAPRQL